ncbi:zeta toxin family protein [Melaminivora suipulveris]|uniref:zeta toxin family protein n=1 Tax=Melaminivora suipulveris TaxID=2109913 RepID=UPI0030038AD3
MTQPAKKVIVIAGPNGAGKTTFARSFLPAEAQLPRFINADLIAAGLAPFAPETAAVRAGRLMLQEIEHSVRTRQSFAIETALSGMGYLRHIARWRTQGYRVSVFFLKLPDAGTAVARVGRTRPPGRARHSCRRHRAPLCRGLAELRALLPRCGR